mmetsp:Transcript_102937/g.266131  ORF Transcript_102937/g.266131 Transcript_102937/m.266131 type:complete len:169 (-) Transcript_102937:9-515(-)
MVDRPYSAFSTATSQRSSRSGRSQRSAAQSVGAEVLRSSSQPRLSFGSAVPVLGGIPYNNLPGYTGHVPGKYSENVLATSHSRTNALALTACSRRGDFPAEDHYARQTNLYGLSEQRRGANVPGYTGYIPGKHSTNVYGHTFANSNTSAQEARRGIAMNSMHTQPRQM